MKRRRLIIRLAGGLVIFLIINWIIRTVFDPSYYYGNDTIEHKMLEYREDPSLYNTILIGSSCIFWNIEPVLFESMQPESWRTYIYNFGSGGTLPPETYNFLGKLLEENAEHIESVIIELRDVSFFPRHHRQTLRKRYFMSPKWYAFIVKANLDSGIPVRAKRNNIVQYGVATLERFLNIDYFNDIYGKSPETKQKYHDRLENLQTNATRGFLPGDPEREEAKHERFLKDTSYLSSLAEMYRVHKANRENLNLNSVHLARILRIIEECDRRGVHCIFLMHPKQDRIHLAETIALAEHIPELHLIDISDPDIYPELYLVKNSLNNNHFNIRGTEILTTLAAQKFSLIHSRWLESKEDESERE